MRSNQSTKKPSAQDLKLLSLLQILTTEIAAFETADVITLGGISESERLKRIETARKNLDMELNRASKGFFKSMISCLSWALKYDLDEDGEKEESGKQFRRAFTAFLDMILKRYPEMLIPFHSYVVFILSQASFYCTSNYLAEFDLENACWKKAPDADLLKQLKKIQTITGKIIYEESEYQSKIKDDYIDYSVKALYANNSYIFPFQVEEVSQKVNPKKNADKMFCDEEIFVKIKPRIMNTSLSKSRNKFADACLNYWLQVQHLRVLISKRVANLDRTIDEDIIKALNEFDFDALLAFTKELTQAVTGNMSIDLPDGKNSGINIYEKFIHSMERLVLTLKILVTYDKFKFFNDKLNDLKMGFYHSECAKNYFDEKKYQEIIKDNTFVKDYSGLQMQITDPEKALPTMKLLKEKLLDEFILFNEQKIEADIAFATYIELNDLIKTLPVNSLTRIIYSAYTNYLGSYLKKENVQPIYNTYKREVTRLISAIKQEEYSAEWLPHANLVMDVIVVSAFVAMAGYCKDADSLDFLEFLQNIKDALHILIKQIDRNEISNKSAHMLLGCLSYIISFSSRVEREEEDVRNVNGEVKNTHLFYEKKLKTDSKRNSKLLPFLDDIAFAKIKSEARSSFPRNNSDEQCLLFWFDIFNQEIMICGKYAPEKFDAFDCKSLIDFVSKLNYEEMTENNILRKVDFPEGIFLGMNIYLELISHTEKMMAGLEIHFKLHKTMMAKAKELEPGHAAWKTLYQLYKTELKLLTFKSQFYELDFVRKRYSEDKCLQKMSGLNKQIEELNKQLDEMNQKKEDWEKLVKQEYEIRRQVRMLYRSKKKNGNVEQKIILKSTDDDITSEISSAVEENIYSDETNHESDDVTEFTMEDSEETEESITESVIEDLIEEIPETESVKEDIEGISEANPVIQEDIITRTMESSEEPTESTAEPITEDLIEEIADTESVKNDVEITPETSPVIQKNIITEPVLAEITNIEKQIHSSPEQKIVSEKKKPVISFGSKPGFFTLTPIEYKLKKENELISRALIALPGIYTSIHFHMLTRFREMYPGLVMETFAFSDTPEKLNKSLLNLISKTNLNLIQRELKECMTPICYRAFRMYYVPQKIRKSLKSVIFLAYLKEECCYDYWDEKERYKLRFSLDDHKLADKLIKLKHSARNTIEKKPLITPKAGMFSKNGKITNGTHHSNGEKVKQVYILKK